jgi:hypothetical protein
MTAKEFDNQKWYKGMKVKYCNDIYPISGVDFLYRKIQIASIYSYYWLKHLKCEIVEEEQK